MPLAVSKGPPGRHAQALLAAVAMGEGTPAARGSLQCRGAGQGVQGWLGVGGEAHEARQETSERLETA